MLQSWWGWQLGSAARLHGAQVHSKFSFNVIDASLSATLGFRMKLYLVETQAFLKNPPKGCLRFVQTVLLCKGSSAASWQTQVGNT
jgi:hypothetical protein